MTIGDRLREQRIKDKLTAKTLSDLSGVPVKTIYRIEKNEVTDPRISSLLPLLAHLTCASDDILFGGDNFHLAGALKQVFLLVTEMHPHEQNFVIELIKKLSLSESLSRQFSENIDNGTWVLTPIKEEEKEGLQVGS